MDYQAILKKLKRINLSDYHCTLWIIHRPDGKKELVASAIDADAKIKKTLHQQVERAIEASKSCEEYDYLSADPDLNHSLALDLGAAEDLGNLMAQIQDGTLDAGKVKNVKDLVDASSYAISLTKQGKRPILAVKKINNGWSSKFQNSALRIAFQNSKLVSLEDMSIFKLERTIDFFAYENTVFILNKKGFERALNFIEGMRKSCKAMLSEIEDKKLVTDVDKLKNAIGDKVKYLRKAAQIKKNGYYLRENFISRCKKVSKAHKWPITFDSNDKIEITDLNIEVVLHALNGDILTEPLYEEDYFVDGKRKVPSLG